MTTPPSTASNSNSPGTDCCPVVEELLPCPAVEDALLSLAELPNLLLLESARQENRMGRYSFLCADPFDRVVLQEAQTGDDPFADLRALHERFAAYSRDDLPPFQGGAAGLLAYELGRAWERIPGGNCDEFQLPAMVVGLYDWVIAWDHQRQQAWLISQGFPEQGANRRRRAKQRLEEIRELLQRRLPQVDALRTECGRDVVAQSAELAMEPQAARQWSAPGLPALTSDFSRDGYLQAVQRVVDYIHAGDIFQANLSQRLLHPWRKTPLELYRRLRRCNPAPFAGYFAHEDWAVVSASPERFLCVRDGEVETRPIKGTRGRDCHPEADLLIREELRQSEKDQAENVMIVDLLRNDLSRVCSPGTVHVPSLCHVETYETVQHLVSEIRGKLRSECSVWDLIAAAFPGGSITGAPKVRAMEIIAELEPTVRGAYCGSLFYAGFNGTFDSNLLIRTFTVRRGWAQCSVGGGVVALSNPRSEYDETLQKAAGMLRALQD